MRLGVYGATDELLVSVGEIVPSGTDVVPLSAGGEWGQYALVLARVTHWLPGDLTILVERLRKHSVAPVVAVVPFCKRAAMELAAASRVSVVWEDSRAHDLPVVLEYVLALDRRRRIRDTLRHRAGSDSLIARALCVALDPKQTPLPVKGLCRQIPCAVSTLERRWRDFDLPETPRALLEWSLLLSYWDLRSHGGKLAIIASHLRVHTTTLYRVCRRRIGVSPTAVSAALVDETLERWLSSR